MKKLIVAILIFSLFSCNKVKEGMQDATTNAMGKALESKTGTQIDGLNTSNLENNAGFVTYKTNGTIYLSGDEKMQATVIINKDNDGLSIAFQLAGENGKSFMATVSKVPENFTLPLTSIFSVSNSHNGSDPTATILFMNLTENGVEPTSVPFEGQLIITKLSKNDIEFEINAKGSFAADAESPSNWKPILGNGKISNPIVLSYGIDKNKILK
jgi:hypothetical protein